MSNLVDHARRELELAGEDPEFAEHLIKVVETFAEGGHSGSTAAFAIGALTDLLQFRPLTPLTYEPDEWLRHEGFGPNGGDLWQNVRDSRIFSNDGGQTHYNVEEL